MDAACIISDFERKREFRNSKLKDQRNIKPEVQSKYIVLSGTVLRDPDGSLRAPILFFDGGQWCPGFRWLGYGWSARALLPRSK